MNARIQAYTGWLIRVLMAGMFVESGVDKMLNWSVYLAETQGKGIPMPIIALSAAAATEMLGSLALLSGKFLRLGALLLAVYVFCLGFVYFDFWHQQGAAAVMARKEFLKDLAVIAGLLLMALPNRQQSC